MEILTAAQMYAADKETIAKIMPENDLVENAGFAAATLCSAIPALLFGAWRLRRWHSG